MKKKKKKKTNFSISKDNAHSRCNENMREIQILFTV